MTVRTSTLSSLPPGPSFCSFALSLFFICVSSLWADEPYEDLVEQLSRDIPKEWANKTIAVFRFKNQGRGNSSETESIIAEELTTSLIKKRFKVVERTALDKVVSEQKLQQSGLIKQEKAIQIGQGLGADGVIIGSVRNYKAGGVRVNARLVDVKTYQVISAGSTILDSDLFKDYEEAKITKQGGFLLDLMGGGHLFQQTWKRKFENEENVRREPPFENSFASDTYHITDTFSGIRYQPLFSIKGKLSYIFAEDGYYTGSFHFVVLSIGFSYSGYSSEEQTITRNTDRSIQFNFSKTGENSRSSERVSAPRGDFTASVFTVRPGINFKFDFWENHSFLYIGSSFDLGSISAKSLSFPLDQSAFIAGVNVQAGLRLGVARQFGIIGEVSYTPIQNASYADDAEGILQGGLLGGSQIRLSGFAASVGLSFFI